MIAKSTRQGFVIVATVLLFGGLLGLVASLPATAATVPTGAISLSSAYSQTFDSLADTGSSNAWTDDSTLVGWYSTATSYRAGTGSSNAGGLYSFGSTAERALGSIGSGSTGTIYYGARFVNDLGATVTGITVSYTGEQWRNGGNTTPHQLSFSYQTAGSVTSLTSGVWIPDANLDFVGPIANSASGALDGNTATNQVMVSETLAVGLAPGDEIMLRWEDVNDGGADHGLAIDDFMIVADTSGTPPPSPTPILLRPISDVQMTSDPSGDSPLVGTQVRVRGIVLGAYSAGNSSGYAVADAAGAWNGVFVYTGSGGFLPAVGDEVEVVGIVEEFFGLTQIDSASTTVLSSGNSPYPATSVGVGDIATVSGSAESYESTLVEVINTTVSDENPDAPSDFGEFEITDASSVVRVNDLGYLYEPSLGEPLSLVRGMLNYSFSEFKIEPRMASDVVSQPSLSVSKTAPVTVTINTDYVYTISVENSTGITLTGVTITDVIPANTNYVSGGSLSGGVATWNVGTLAPAGTASVDLTVKSTNTPGAVLMNTDYGVRASNWATPATGPAVSTLVSAGAPTVCNAPAILIHDIQGNGLASPLVGVNVVIEGVVVGDFQNTTTELDGFFIQEEASDQDSDSTTSEGIFVLDNGLGVDVQIGDTVRVAGEVAEYFDKTEITAVSSVTVCGSGATVAPTAITLPVADLDDMEAFEGMLVTFPQTLYVTEHYNVARYGELSLSITDRLDQPTQVRTPGASANALLDLNNRSRIVLDDGSTNQNPPTVPHLGADDTIRGGDTTENLTGVLDYSFEFYRVQPLETVSFDRVNERTTAPADVGGRIKVASFNVLNYFNGDGMGGGFPTSRGADSLQEFNRQRDKIIAAITQMDVDIIGLMEIENDGYGANSAIQDLVNGLNAQAPAGVTYAFVASPEGNQLGTDEIAVGLIYNSEVVDLLGTAETLSTGAFSDLNRQPLAQTFEEPATGAHFTVVVNHFKSKGCGSATGAEADQGDGQGCWNPTRTAAATELAAWLANDPTDSDDDDYLVLGDINAYAQEDPLTAFSDAYYTDLLEDQMADDYSYVFFGQWGTLDYALANTTFDSQVTGATVWHINADEPRALDYNEEFNPPYLYNPDAYRASDHDPIIIGLNPISRDVNLVITKTADIGMSPISPGDTIDFTIQIQNTGTDAAENVSIVDTLPAFLIGTDLNTTITINPGITYVTTISAQIDPSTPLSTLITNTASYSYLDQTGSDSVTIRVRGFYQIYLPIITDP